MKDTAAESTTRELQALRDEVTRLRRALADAEPVQTSDTVEVTRGVMDSAGVAMVQISPDGEFVHVNLHARRLLGLPLEKFAAMSLRHFEGRTIWPDGSPCGYDDYPAIRCLRTGKPQPPTTIGVRLAEGEILWTTVTVNPLLQASEGTCQSVIATLMDVTHSKQIEEALRQSEDRYWSLVERSPYAIVVHHGGEIVFVNDAAMALWRGKSRDKFVGRDILDFVHPRHRDAASLRLAKTMAGETSSPVEQLQLRCDGRTVHVEVTGLPCFYDGKPCVQEILRDTTKRKRAQRQVRKQREILKKFFDHIPALVGFFDVEGRITLVNREWRRVLGWGTELSIPQLLIRCFPDPVARRKAHEYLQTEQDGWQDFRVRVRDGRTLDISAARIMLSDGTRIAIGTDVTKRKAAEQALRRNKAELEARVAARTDEISRKNHELELEVAERRHAESMLKEKQRFMERLLSAQERDRQLVAYEIHDTFLQGVIAALMYLDPSYDERGEPAEQTGQRLKRVRKLLRKSIDEARRMISGLRPPLIDEQGAVAAIEYLINELNARGMEIEFDHAVDLGRLDGEVEAAVFRIVQEALVNVERHSQSKQCRVGITQSSGLLRLEVQDFGVGFDRQAVGEGHFGLQGIEERTRLIGGTVSITSRPGQGTQVLVEIPVLPL